MKIDRNRAVDVRTELALHNAGWRVGTVWECAMRGKGRLSMESILEAYSAWLKSDASELVIRGQ